VSVPRSRALASVLRAKFGVDDDALRLWPASTGAGSPPDGYAIVEVGGEAYTVPALLGAVSKDAMGAQVAGETAWLLVTRDSITAIGRPDLPEYEPPWPVEPVAPVPGAGGSSVPVEWITCQSTTDLGTSFTKLNWSLVDAKYDTETPTFWLTEDNNLVIAKEGLYVIYLHERAMVLAPNVSTVTAIMVEQTDGPTPDTLGPALPVEAWIPRRINPPETATTDVVNYPYADMTIPLGFDHDAFDDDAPGAELLIHAYHEEDEVGVATAFPTFWLFAARIGSRKSRESELVYHWKVTRDDEPVTDAEWTFAIPQDMDGVVLSDIEIDVTTPGSTPTTVQVERVDDGATLLSTLAQIDASTYHSEDSISQPSVLDEPLAHKDRIRVYVEDAGTGALGLGVVLYFAEVPV
jgi:hypothetical protein